MDRFYGTCFVRPLPPLPIRRLFAAICAMYLTFRSADNRARAKPSLRTALKRGECCDPGGPFLRLPSPPQHACDRMPYSRFSPDAHLNLTSSWCVSTDNPTHYRTTVKSAARLFAFPNHKPLKTRSLQGKINLIYFLRPNLQHAKTQLFLLPHALLQHPATHCG